MHVDAAENSDVQQRTAIVLLAREEDRTNGARTEQDEQKQARRDRERERQREGRGNVIEYPRI